MAGMATIVLADDDVDVQLVAATALRRAGHEVVTCDDGAQLLSAVRAAVPDVIVTDHQMPVMSGLEARAVLRAEASTADVPVIGASGSVGPEQAAGVLSDGDQLLPKPYSAGQL